MSTNDIPEPPPETNITDIQNVDAINDNTPLETDITGLNNVNVINDDILNC